MMSVIISVKNEDGKLMILYWKESIGGKTLLYLLNYDGDIIVKEEIRNGS